MDILSSWLSQGILSVKRKLLILGVGAFIENQCAVSIAKHFINMTSFKSYNKQTQEA